MTESKSNDFFESEAWKAYEAKENEKRKSIKRGPNVIHLEYLGPLLPDNYITECEEQVEKVGLQLSHYDTNGTMYASLDTFELVIYLGIAQPLINELIQGITTNATWDVIKFLLLSTWRKVRNKSYTKATNSYSEKKELTFGLKVHLDKNTSFNLKLDGAVEESTIEKSLDQVLNFLGEQKLNEKYKNTDFAFFDNEKSKWIKVDVEKEIRKMVKNKEIKRK